MAALIPTDHYATVAWLGRVAHRDRRAVEGHACDTLELAFGGPKGEHHSGLTRPACSRVRDQHPGGTEIANVRQVTILSSEELTEIGREIGVEPMDPAWLGATIVLEGLDDLTHLPPSARLQGEDGVTLVVDMLNEPCKLPALAIEQAMGRGGSGFTAAAEGRRGVTAWVERPGHLRIGERLRLHLPRQRTWQGAARADTS